MQNAIGGIDLANLDLTKILGGAGPQGGPGGAWGGAGRVAVLVNEEAFPGRELPPYVLKEGDVVEVVALMQGG
jgi:sulfur carrier protein ThiS